jgi:hypothetical protein
MHNSRLQLICVCAVFLWLSNASTSMEQESSASVTEQPTTKFITAPIAQQRKGLDSWPKIIAPHSPAVDRANQTIAKMNQSTSDALRECDDDYRQFKNLPESARVKGGWDRKVRITMRGPRFVAMVADETSFCDGSYPNNDHVAVVFDMSTGELVNWTSLMTGVDETAATTFKSIDGATTSGISTSGLTELALNKSVKDSECKKALESLGQLEFQVWPDAKRGQLVIKPIGLPHVVQACEEDIGLSIPEARKQGFSEAILGAIEQARRSAASTLKK